MGKSEKREFDVAIIGAGPAGISAACWCAELGLEPVLFEAGDVGGQLNNIFGRIGNHLGATAKNGKELKKIFVAQMNLRSIAIIRDTRISGIDLERHELSAESGNTYGFKALVIATGVRRRKLGVEGEEEFQGKGILLSGRFSGRRDRELARGKRVVVVGGGDAAFENVGILSEIAAEVFLVHRSKTFRAREDFVKKAKATPNVTIFTNSIIRKIEGNGGIGGGEILGGLILENAITGEEMNLKTDALLIRIGVQPNTEFIMRNSVQLDGEGYIKINSNCQTNFESVYAIGDVASPFSPTISTAIGMGATAAKSIKNDAA